MDTGTPATPKTVTGARALVDALLREGIDHVFGIPGTQNLAIIDALRETPQIRFILTRHEQGAAFMAYGFARATGRAAVVTATEGPGVTNLATPMAAALRGFAPVISVSGLQRSWIREREATQDIDQYTFFRPITKWAYSIPNAGKIQESVRKAFRIALAEPPGPTHIDAETEVYQQRVTSEEVEPAAYRSTVLPDCNRAQLDAAYALIRAARKPVFLIGAGVLREEASAAMARLAERTGIPVTTTLYTPDAFPSTHPLALGPLGRNGWGCANRNVPQADLIIAVGVHMDVYSTTFKYGIFSESAKLIHHSAAPGQLGIVFPFTLGVTGSTMSFINGLSERAGGDKPRQPWFDIAKARAEWEAEQAAAVRPDAEPVQPQYVAETLRKVLPRDGILVVDGGNAAKHVRNRFHGHEPRTFIGIDDWASIGGAFPMALGAKLARPERAVLCASGDMGAMCNIGELETAVREKIPVVFVVMNDEGLGNERAYQHEHYGGRMYAVDYQNPDFGALARVFRAHGEQVRKPGELEGALRRAFASGKPAIVEVVIDQNAWAPVVYKPE